jgi:hypothetical protein
MDHKRDKIGVFVSIVSTKIPYKGTGKEYIGDDITEISVSVKRTLQSCCQMLRTHLQKRNALRDRQERKGKLCKYIPDVSRSLFALLDSTRRRHLESSSEDSSPRKRLKSDESKVETMIDRLVRGDITEAIIKQNLEKSVDVQSFLDHEDLENKTQKNTGIPLYLRPILDKAQNRQHAIQHPLFTFRCLIPTNGEQSPA